MALTFGEQAICKSVEEVLRLPVRQRDALIRKLGEAYKRQKEEMDKTSRQSKGGRRTTTTATY